MSVATTARLNPVTQRRLELEDAVERALAALDALDDDPDLEDADPDSEHDGREPEEDDDQSDREPSLCGIFMPASGGQGDDREATSAPFSMDQTVSA